MMKFPSTKFYFFFPLYREIITKEQHPISENAPSPTSTACIEESVTYIACYPYESTEVGDLVFTVGEHIQVVKKDGDWWTGIIGERSGIFPSNYVQEMNSMSNTTAVENLNELYEASENIQNGNEMVNSKFQQPQKQQIQVMMEEAKTQEDADTEVSEINTQPIADRVHETYSRPMSTSTTPVKYCILEI